MDYDEDLLVNPFYKALTTKGKELYQHATDNRWTVCIPRKGTTSRSQYKKEQFETHLLQLLNETNNTYQTVNEKEVKINGSFIVTTKGFEDVKSIQILFEETFFNRNEESYHVLCIDQPLGGGAFSSHAQPVVQSLETLQNCIDFLWSGTGTKRSQRHINEIISLFNSTYTRLASESVRHTMDAVNAVFTRAIQACLKESHLRRPAMSNKAFMDDLKVAVETYVTDGVFKHVFKGISSFLTEEDAAFNKTTRNLADLQVKDLGINTQLCKNIPKAKKILSNLNKFTTPLEKLYVLKFTIASMSEASRLRKEDDFLTADDLLPALVFLVVKSEIPNWLANLSYMQNFHFSRSKSDEFQFYLSSTEAAIEHVRSGRLDSLITMNHMQRQNVVNSLFQRLDSTSEKVCGPSAVDVLFENIRSNKLVEVTKMLNDSITAMKEVTELMCHPLCSCDACEKLLTSKRKDPTAVTVFSRDDIGCTALHQAAEFGCEAIIYELIKKGGVVNATNYHGSTPLHLACQRGHHKVIVILTHYGADINACDNANNTPLHLAVANGHEMCVEYLCSGTMVNNDQQKLDIDAANEHGDSALHIASRWGFSRLVFLLLKNGASNDIKNKNNNTPLQCALNIKIQEIFLQDTQDEQKEDGYIYLPFSNQSAMQQPTTTDGDVSRDSPKTSRRKRDFATLLKAVAAGDIELVEQKLGLPNESDVVADDPDVGRVEDMLCHPLCQCEKCAVLQKKVVNESISINANMSNQDGVCALHVASLHGYEKIVNLLLKRAGADPNVKTKTNQRTPLHLACQYNNIECVSFLLKNGARVNIKDSGGNTALHFCCTNGHIGPAILLLQSGANVNSVNQRGNTPLHDSSRWNFVDLSRLLLYYNAPTDVKNKMQMTPLQYARGEEVQSLLETAIQKKKKDTDLESNVNKKVSKLSFNDDSNEEILFNPSTQLATSSTIINSCKNDTKGGTPYDHSFVSQSLVDTNSKNTDSSSSCSNCATSKYGNKSDVQKVRRPTVADLFDALEEQNLRRLKEIANGIRNFDRDKSLRKVSTTDKSFSYLDQHYKTMVSIQRFNQSILKHVDIIQLEKIKDTPVTSKPNETLNLPPDSTSVSSHSSNRTENSNIPDGQSDKSVASELESPMIGSAELSFDFPTSDLPEGDSDFSNYQTLTRHELEESLVSEKEQSFEDWFETEIATDSADEETEEAVHVVVDQETPHETLSTPQAEHIQELLSEAIHDDGNSSVQPITPVRLVLVEDDHLFIPR